MSGVTYSTYSTTTLTYKDHQQIESKSAQDP